jgi:hypothetical protein
MVGGGRKSENRMYEGNIDPTEERALKKLLFHFHALKTCKRDLEVRSNLGSRQSHLGSPPPHQRARCIMNSGSQWLLHSHLERIYTHFHFSPF